MANLDKVKYGQYMAKGKIELFRAGAQKELTSLESHTPSARCGQKFRLGISFALVKASNAHVCWR